MPDEAEEIGQGLLNVVNEDAGAATPPKLGTNPVDWYLFSKSKRAAVIDDAVLKQSACVCYETDGKRACFSRSAFGVLADDQVQICGSVDTQPMTDEIRRLLEASSECSGGLSDWVSCMVQKVPELGK